MIKGKYVAVIEAEFNIPDDRPGLLTFEEMNKNLNSDSLPKGIHDVMMDYVFPPEFTTLKVSPSTCYLYKEDNRIEDLA